MPRGSTYADNASNRSLGRVGMTMGSAVQSSRSSGSSGGSINFSSYSGYNSVASAPRTYVDNSQNRSLGRVGMSHGSQPVSNSSSSSRTYVDNSQNRSLGRVGMSHGSQPVSNSSSSSSSRTYVDNSQNRSLGRVGMSHGSQPVSNSSSSSRTYVDNSQNRSLGRVGMSHGSQPVSNSSSSSRTYVDNSQNRSLGRVGMSHGSQPVSNSSSSSRTYVDNSQNRSLGRVGMSHGSQPVSNSSSSSRTYVDNSQNRGLGRVGKPVGLQPVSNSSSPTRTYVDNRQNQLLGRVGQPHGSQPAWSKEVSKDCYVNNAYNRSLGRVGLKYGSATAPAVLQQKNEGPKKTKLYVNNAANRRLGRVGKPIGSMPASLQSESDFMKKAFHHLQNNEHEEFDSGSQSQYDQYPRGETDGYATNPCNNHEREAYEDLITEMWRRMEAWQLKKEISMSGQGDEASCSASYYQQSVTGSVNKSIDQSYSGAVIQYKDIQLGQKIGHGGFGDIYDARWNGFTVAVKKLRVQRVSKKRLAQFTEEIKLFSKLKHKNIISFYGACLVTPNICMVMELMEGSLFDKIHTEEEQFTHEQKIIILEDIANGLVYLHSNDVSHCDMKSANVLLSVNHDNDIIDVKITDFGLSMMKNDSDTTTSSDVKLTRNIGTPRYSAPEILLGELLDRKALMKADVYSFGLIMHEVFSEEIPFEDLNLHQLRRLVGEGDHTPRLDILKNEIDEELIDLIKVCWSRNAEDRPSADALLAELLQ